MTEILVVIGIIVLLLAIGVPAFNLIRGGRSLDSAENQVAAMLGRARSNAIGLQKVHGIMFIVDTEGNAADPVGFRTYIAEVVESDYPAGGTRDVYLDLTDTEFIPLPPGVGVQTLNEAPAAANERYLGFNDLNAGSSDDKWIGGVILFNGRGQVINRTYGFRSGPATPTSPRMNDLVLMFTSPSLFVNPGTDVTPPSSAFGLVLFDRSQFLTHGNDTDAQVSQADPAGEETWIDDNGVPLLVNRYNGSLVRGSQ
ncbi:MAG: hypothetical protein QOF78_2580 [Phycisphaerales bacterium]|nr:hypothetical protein [Phycisphaerales bacterium]